MQRSKFSPCIFYTSGLFHFFFSKLAARRRNGLWLVSAQTYFCTALRAMQSPDLYHKLLKSKLGRFSVTHVSKTWSAQMKALRPPRLHLDLHSAASGSNAPLSDSNQCGQNVRGCDGSARLVPWSALSQSAEDWQVGMYI